MRSYIAVNLQQLKYLGVVVDSGLSAPARRKGGLGRGYAYEFIALLARQHARGEIDAALAGTAVEDGDGL